MRILKKAVGTMLAALVLAAAVMLGAASPVRAAQEPAQGRDAFEYMSKLDSGVLTGSQSQPDAFVFRGAYGITLGEIKEQDGNRAVQAFYPQTPSASVNDIIKNYITGQISSFNSLHSEGALDIRFDSHYYDANTVSFVFRAKVNGETAEVRAMAFDLTGGARLELAQLFSVGYDYGGELSYRALPKLGVTPGADGYNNFAFDEENLYIYIDKADGGHAELITPIWEFGGNWAAAEYAAKHYRSVLWSADELYQNGADDAYYPVDASAPPGGKWEAGRFLEGVTPVLDNKKYIAITFDDGPDRLRTEKILDAMIEYNAKGTFFLQGHRAAAMPDIVARIHNEGHSVGNHSYNHKQLNAISDEALAFQVLETNKIIEKITGEPVTLLRPPYGESNDKVVNLAKSLNMSIINWDIDPRDWTNYNAQAVASHVIERAQDGSIIILHDNYDTTVEAAAIIIKELTARDFIFVTVGELIEMNAGMKPGMVYRNGKSGN
ncbi:MAG: polysaccharide deacetylase family protein [Clostridiales bacterium]|jgi:peptidoglycan/xylan/chitin deacetylase (PgdA/CDA1 family)|nr:polysaccharide deacetylase family protein [Clostridiales bacterium]